jgi:hypothetical protein
MVDMFGGGDGGGNVNQLVVARGGEKIPAWVKGQHPFEGGGGGEGQLGTQVMKKFTTVHLREFVQTKRIEHTQHGWFQLN